MKLRKIITIVSIIVVIGGTVIAYNMYKKVFTPNTAFSNSRVAFYIPSDATYSQVQDSLKPYIEDMERFNWVAEKKKYPGYIKSGKIVLTNGMNSNEIIAALRNPVPVKVTFNNQETLQHLAGRLGEQIEPDSIALLEAFTDKVFLQENGFTEENVLSIFIPNTYEFYWNTSATKVRDKIAKEYRKFWTAERKAKAEAVGLTPLQVSILASIVHKETVKKDERPRVAGVYLNRLKMGMPLEADPTVIYAKKKNAGDFNLVYKRVLNADLQIDSPYNTYKNGGLPPGPIAMPDISAIDAVLNPEKHNYIYFCASVDRPGYHEFAVTHAQHVVNSIKYHQWLNKLNIKR
ncbi:endolytic transglycosylase MltG [Flavobacterium rhizosphaerae]|uniref:Endolytic murein transglycosylase n=1 Tax=Flavobacterium rhizosphaerae TaxID=3163298 RepID=A0ABW8YWV8_9FLAO